MELNVHYRRRSIGNILLSSNAIRAIRKMKDWETAQWVTCLLYKNEDPWKAGASVWLCNPNIPMDRQRAKIGDPPPNIQLV